jgi:hypothetical protein
MKHVVLLTEARKRREQEKESFGHFGGARLPTSRLARTLAPPDLKPFTSERRRLVIAAALA